MNLGFDLQINLDELRMQSLQRSFEELDAQIQKEAEEFLLHAARILIDDIQSEAPEASTYRGDYDSKPRTRRLKDSFHSTPVAKHGNNLSIEVYEDDAQQTDWHGASVGLLVTQGTRPHTITAKDGGALSFHWDAGFQNLARDRSGALRAGAPKGRPRGNLFVNPKWHGGKKVAGRTILGEGARSTRTKSDSTLFFFNSVKHPGSQPNDFFSRAIAKAAPKIEALKERLIEAIHKKWSAS